MQKTLIILAAGMGSRFGWIKQIARIGDKGETLLDFTLQDAIHAGFTDVIYIIRKEIEEDFKNIIWNTYKDILNTEYVYQEIEEPRTKPRGTGHALSCVLPVLHSPCLLINADDYYGADSMQQASRRLENCKVDTFGMIGYILEKTLSENGSVNRGICTIEDNHLQSITETFWITRTPDGLQDRDGKNIDPQSIASMNFWMFHDHTLLHLKSEFEKWQLTAKEWEEYYVGLYCNRLIKKFSLECEVLIAQDNRYGITYKEDVEIVRKNLLG